MYWSPFVSHHKPKLQINVQNQNGIVGLVIKVVEIYFSYLKKLITKEQYDELAELVDDLPRYIKKDEKSNLVKLPQEFKPLWNGGDSIVKKHVKLFTKTWYYKTRYIKI